MEAFTTHTSVDSVKRRSSRIEGRATPTMVVSSTIISSPRHRTMRASQRLRLSILVKIFSLLLFEALFHLAKALDRLTRTEILQLEELPDFDLRRPAVDGGIRKAPRPFHRLFARLHLNDRVAGDEFLRFGEGPVDYGALRARVFHAPAFRARLKARGVEQDARLLQLLVVLLHLRHKLLGGHHARLGLLRRLDYHHESHRNFSNCSGAWPRTVPAG